MNAYTKSLAWNFKMGPLEDTDTAKKNIRFRLYGRTKSTVSRCYGECFVVLAHVVEGEGSVEFCETLLPKGTLKNMSVKCKAPSGSSKKK